jgi:hypothetical protein
MNLEIVNRELIPTANNGRLNALKLEDSIHVFPSNGKTHHTRQCWCGPEVVEDVETGLPLFVHKQLH